MEMRLRRITVVGKDWRRCISVTYAITLKSMKMWGASDIVVTSCTFNRNKTDGAQTLIIPPLLFARLAHLPDTQLMGRALIN